ncbi:hypothetical protein [Burkholderia multivorans]|uniref:hypothetical protein n=2 Tax=Burkholderia multivorans TaxID=87883 RepID=UPI001C959DF7|nr:hypothetical protein [Burkholderia multivorans]
MATITLLAGCAIERAQTAASAQTGMLGLSKGEILACMGVPQAKATEGNVEVWRYDTGNGRTDSFSNGYSNTVSNAVGAAEATRIGNTVYAAGAAAGNSQTNSFGHSMSRHRSCTVSVVMTNGIVSRVNYSGPTGGLLTKGEQCAYAVENCVK